MAKRQTGQLKDGSFQVGVRKTIPISPAEAWQFMWSEEALEIWLGTITTSRPELNENFQTKEGVKAKITTLKPNSHVRMKWEAKDWDHDSILQVRVIPNKDKTTFSFHQEQLQSETERMDMKEHWRLVLRKLEQMLV